MQERANFFEEGIDRVQSAWTSVEDELEKFQKNFEKRRKRIEKQTEKQVKWLRKTPLAPRVGCGRVCQGRHLAWRSPPPQSVQ